MIDLNLIPSTGRQSPLQIRAAVVEKVTADLPVQEVPNIKSLPHLQGLVLADPNLNKSSRIDMLIGMGYFNDFVIPGVITPSASQLRIYQTIFGWVIAGQCNTSATEEVAHVSLHTSIVDTPSTDILRSFWVVEGINSPKHAITAEEQQTVDFFQKTYSRDGEGHYHVSLTRKTCLPALENSRDRVVKRYLHSERSLSHSGKWEAVKDVMEEYFQLGQAERVPSKDLLKPDSECYYLPYHGVVKATSTTTKLRVVFDASAQSTNGNCLNDLLIPGPTLYPPLFDILLKFRLHKIGMSADSRKLDCMKKIETSIVSYGEIQRVENWKTST